MLKKILLFWILILNLFIYQNIFAESLNLKVYSSDIWLSTNLINDDEKVRIYARFKNPNNFDTKKKVIFLDNGQKIGEKIIEIAKKESVVAWIDTFLKEGEHNILIDTEENLKTTAEGEEKIENKDEKIYKKIFIEKDSDGDKIPDSKDPDDDNDGFSDEEEIKAGTNPLSKLSNPETKKIQDGLKIGKEKISEGAEVAKNVTKDLIEVLTEKKEALKKQIDLNLEKKEEKEKIEREIKKEKIKEEIKKIKKEIQATEKEIQKEKEIPENKYLKIFEKEFKNIQDLNYLTNFTRKKIQEIKNSLISESEKNKKIQAILKLKKESLDRILKLKEKENKELDEKIAEKTWWDKIMIFFSWILSSWFWTILFLIIFFWLLWKIIKFTKRD